MEELKQGADETKLEFETRKRTTQLLNETFQNIAVGAFEGGISYAETLAENIMQQAKTKIEEEIGWPEYKRQNPRAALLELHGELCNKAIELMKKKNNDYSHGDDPYNNFRGSTMFHVEPEIGILLRMSDKMKRIETFVNSNNLKVENESVMDSVIDIINYAVLVAGLLNERMERQTNNM